MIELQSVSKRYGDAIVVDDLSLHIEAGTFFALIGPSGCGKSTTLRMINRLTDCSSGRILFGGQDITSLPPEALRRRIGYAIQSVGLFPHWTVAQNIATVPRLLRWPAPKITARIEELLALLQMNPGTMCGKYPHELSGGQQQRVGVARALAADPDALLMDEPFGALDPITRAALQQEIAHIHATTGKTIVFVTHDMEEALALANRIAVMDQGRLVQIGTPVELLTDPANDFVRSFVGQGDLGLRLLSTETVACRVRAGAMADGVPLPASATLRQALSAMVERRTERISVADAHGNFLGVVCLEDLIRC
jgi:osmoprotectant transport system ATP-binding protein